jgi:hypothetical protein
MEWIVKLIPEWIYVESFVNRTENFYALLAYNKNVTFKIEVQNDVPPSYLNILPSLMIVTQRGFKELD